MSYLQGFIVHIFSLQIRLGRHQPGFDQIFIKTITESSNRDVVCAGEEDKNVKSICHALQRDPVGTSYYVGLVARGWGLWELASNLPPLNSSGAQQTQPAMHRTPGGLEVGIPGPRIILP